MDASAISDQIDRIVRSRSFAGKSQLRRLLEILHRNMDSQTTLKTDGVIRELWPGETRTKRPADVATEMNRLRHALENYYRNEGSIDPITVYLPNRSPAALNGRQEKLWIATKRRDASEEHLAGPAPVAIVNSRRGWKTMTAVAILGIAATYVSFRVLTRDKRPQFARLDGSMLVIMNAEGKELWKKAFPEGFATDWYYAQGLATRTWFGDLEGKGHTSVVFSYLSASGPQSRSTTLICYSDRGQEKWRWTPGRDLPELHGTPATYKTVALKVLKPARNKGPRIVVSSMHDPWWPNQIAVLDGSGNVLSEYWHSGHLEYLTLTDLDRDGRQEIIAAGISNGYHQATLVVLDPDRVSGASTETARPELQIHGMGFAHERLRLLFPRSDLNVALASYNAALEPTVENGSIRLSVKECSVPLNCPIWYEFDSDFHLLTAYADDLFRSAHAQFFLNRKDSHLFSAEEQAAFQRVRCLVGCKSEFVPVGSQVR